LELQGQYSGVSGAVGRWPDGKSMRQCLIGVVVGIGIGIEFDPDTDPDADLAQVNLM
jgi:hypothetical protein